jgi:hypothetical protein
MKFMTGSVLAVVAVLAGIAAWTLAGRLMIQKDDLSVTLGVLIMAGLLGVVTWIVAWVVGRIVKPKAENVLSKETRLVDKKVGL